MRTGRLTAKARLGLGPWASAIAGAALSFSAAGCGGGGYIVGSCGVAPCGGDVVGEWTASSACIDHDQLANDILSALGTNTKCSKLSLGDVNMTPVGTLTIGADMMYTGAVNADTTMDLIFPPECIDNNSCSMVQQLLETSRGFNSVSCVGTGSCTCTAEVLVDVINATGTWSTSGTTLTFSGLPMASGPYCLDGSSLHLVGLDGDAGTKVISDLVLTKQ